MAGTATLTATVRDGPPWGRPVVFIEASGDPEAIRDEYARRAPEWPRLQMAIVEASPEALEPWYRLGFAQMHAYAVRASGGTRHAVPGVAVRPGGPADLEVAMRIDRVIHDVQAQSPSFAARRLDEAQHRRDWEETLAADDVAYFVAERDGRPAGHVTLYPEDGDEGALHLASTAVLAEAQGRGVGLVLTTHALAYAAEQGYPRLCTNWRVTNLGASRYWPARGFEVTKIRLVRELRG